MRLGNFDLIWRETQAQAEAAARERQWFTDFFAHSPQACLITDRYAMVRSANVAAAALLGRNPAGKPLALFVPLAERQEFRRNVSLLATRAQWTCSAFAVDVRRAPGSLCWTLT